MLQILFNVRMHVNISKLFPHYTFILMHFALMSLKFYFNLSAQNKIIIHSHSCSKIFKLLCYYELNINSF